MTDIYAPYESPQIQSRGWIVGPTEHPSDLAEGGGDGLPADFTVDVGFVVDVGSTALFPLTFPYTFGAPLGGGGGLDAELLYSPVANISTLPATGDGDGLSAGFSVDVPVAMDLADGSGGTAIVPTLTVTVPVAVQGTPNVAAATSVTIPTHAVGDIIVIFAMNGTNSTTPGKPTAAGTVPAWVDIDANTGSGSAASREVYFVATATNHTSGTWTNLNGLCAVVLRNQNASPLGGHAEADGSSTTSIAAPSITMTATDGSSVLLHCHMARVVGLPTWSSPPAGYTRLATLNSGGHNIALNTKTASTSDGTVSNTISLAALNSRGATVEIKR